MQNQASGFLKSLFDISFTSLITTRIIKVIYVLSLVGIGIFYLGWVIGAFSTNAAFGLLVLLVLGPLGVVLWAILVRVYLEVVIALFRIMETNVEMVGLLRRGSPPPPTGPTG
ncbi:MAG: DUF4282 domain-containing protein [Actinomycetota bacterium]